MLSASTALNSDRSVIGAYGYGGVALPELVKLRRRRDSSTSVVAVTAAIVAAITHPMPQICVYLTGGLQGRNRKKGNASPSHAQYSEIPTFVCG